MNKQPGRSLDMLKKASVEERWQNHLKKYHSRNPLAGALLDRYFNKLGLLLGRLKPDARVLEVGCGSGESTRRVMGILEERYLEISEYEGRYVSKLKEKFAELKVTQESVYELKRKDDEFDCILLLEVLEHLEDPERALLELFRVSSRFVIISVPHEPIWRIMNLLRLKYWTRMGNTPAHIHHWSIPGLKNLISRFGTVRRVYAPLPWIIILAEKADEPRARV